MTCYFQNDIQHANNQISIIHLNEGPPQLKSNNDRSLILKEKTTKFQLQNLVK
jgi:hypothetical protein